MDKLKDSLWPIILVGGLGAFIDFLIGKAGQEKARDCLLKWWVRFDHVHWKSFGREEGLFPGQLIQQLLGRRIWSMRRVTASSSPVKAGWGECARYVRVERVSCAGLEVAAGGP